LQKFRFPSCRRSSRIQRSELFAAGTRKIETGIAVFFQEPEKYGLELDEHSVDRFRVAEGQPGPSNEEMKRLANSCSSFGITKRGFYSGKKLTALLEKLLAD
jgi:hypothetical protein